MTMLACRYQTTGHIQNSSWTAFQMTRRSQDMSGNMIMWKWRRRKVSPRAMQAAQICAAAFAPAGQPVAL